MPMDPDFVEDCCYGPGGLLIDDVLEVDRERSLIRVRMPTSPELPLTREQRAHPVRHPRHVSGGLMVHMTGVAGLVHAYYVLDLRHRAGWVGYGGAIHRARFKSLAPPGEPIEISCRATQVRRRAKNIVARYELRFLQGGVEVYEGDQTAMWIRVEDGDASAS
jgi:3-hydroxymyristoyl/3-hydroxydecanoyl-(acyl carrier protein) dehydratase